MSSEKNKPVTPDLGRYRKKLSDQAKTIKELREKLATYERGAAETSRLLDSILAELAVEYGEKDEQGVYTLAIPLVSVLRNTRDYDISADVRADNDAYVISCRRRGTHDAES